MRTHGSKLSVFSRELNSLFKSYFKVLCIKTSTSLGTRQKFAVTEGEFKGALLSSRHSNFECRYNVTCDPEDTRCKAGLSGPVLGRVRKFFSCVFIRNVAKILVDYDFSKGIYFSVLCDSLFSRLTLSFRSNIVDFIFASVRERYRYSIQYQIPILAGKKCRCEKVKHRIANIF